MFKNNFNNFYNQLIYFIRTCLVIMAVLLLFRISFLIVYGNKTDLAGNLTDLFHAFIAGLRFDTTVTTYGMVIPFLLLFSTLLVPARFNKYQAFVGKFIFYYGLFLLFLFLSISLVDFYFYKFFQFHINILFFGIVNDDTFAVLRSVWTDYPVIGILIFVTVSMLLLRYILKKLSLKKYINPINRPVYKTLLIFVLLLSYGIGMRGSLGTFTLEIEDSIVSENSFINTLTINGVFSLKNAIMEKKDQKIDTDIQKTIAKNDFTSKEEVISTYLDGNVLDTKDVEQQLTAYTKRDSFLQENPPNVVFIQMESFGNHYLDFNSPTLNLLGRLESQMKECILFRNFLSATSGTIHTLEGLMLGTPLTPVSQSTFMDCSLNSSVALPFKKSGYHTNFVTSADLGWRNLDKFVARQYFETVEGAESLLKKVPNSSRCQWGVFDEFLFERMFKILSDGNGKPQFIFSMTTTNHTPFELPSQYKRYPVAVPESIKKVLRTNEDIAVRNFTNYQYANDCLGRFIEMVRNSPLGENTIIAATGDHSSVQLFNFTDNQALQKFSVPLLLYVPERYLPDNKIDTSRFGSHRDIFPTLFNMSLSDAAYMKTGNNLFDPEGSPDNFAVLNYNLAMDNTGCVEFEFEPLFYKWTACGSGLLQPTTVKETPELAKLLRRAKAYKTAMSVYIQTDLERCKQ